MNDAKKNDNTVNSNSVQGEEKVIKIYKMLLPIQMFITVAFFFYEFIFIHIYQKYYMFFFIVLLFFYFYFYFIKKYLSKIKWFLLFQYLNTTLEISVVTLAILIFSLSINPDTVLIGPFIMIYILVIVATGFRQSLQISFYAAILAVIQHLLIFYYLIKQVKPDILMAIIDFGPQGTFQKTLYILLAGLISGLLANHTKKIINNVSKSTLEQYQLKNTFGQYVSNEVRDYVLRADFDGAGDLKYGAVLFSDLRNFTTIMESSQSKFMLSHLNEYFTEMVDIIQMNNGVVSKFVGDAILAVFGVFSYEKDSISPEDFAVMAAIQMEERLEELNKIWLNDNKAHLKMGIGIDSGNLIVGNVGCEDRMEFTCIGEVVNSAMDIEDLTKRFNVKLLISDNVHSAIKDNISFESRIIAHKEAVCDGKKFVSLYTVEDQII
ncbi:MAG: hypothetical protein A2015_12945 [Spirochaetes bacterium GWF1_31_7]|nr:MAG: hypothetical protein A2Y30_00350 [Spirochaetes bacterium GWE1_32_154]OHD51292.1 MAG: hypothetical protein A2Y29_00795 [Spirochaetes bacterium GWE2_31_10]OHD51489.1 MAG: hypothetical protein A2015_12945 [Spirochaetes bacterium GWF1_31_7]HBD93654.1 hypothetical protein [Spirochaetia bacterium]HBI38113.1 hypothetical protein [Spirochaetia bacterium]